MSDHADTIRRYITEDGTLHRPPWSSEALAALDALLAERQQAQQEIEGLKVARQDEITARRKCAAERQQAIDALREIAAKTAQDSPPTPVQRIARAALVKLGEQP